MRRRLGDARGTAAKQSGRQELLDRLKNELRPLEQFDAAMQGAPPHVGIPLRHLLRRGIELRGELGEPPELSPLERERLPDYATWWRHREQIDSPWRRSSRTSAATAFWPGTHCGDCRRRWPTSIGRWN